MASRAAVFGGRAALLFCGIAYLALACRIAPAVPAAWSVETGEFVQRTLVARGRLFAASRETLDCYAADGRCLWSRRIQAGNVPDLVDTVQGIAILEAGCISMIGLDGRERWVFDAAAAPSAPPSPRPARFVVQEQYDYGSGQGYKAWSAAGANLYGVSADGSLAWRRRFVGQHELASAEVTPLGFFLTGEQGVQRCNALGEAGAADTRIAGYVDRVTPASDGGWLLECSEHSGCGSDGRWLCRLDAAGELLWSSSRRYRVALAATAPDAVTLLTVDNGTLEPTRLAAVDAAGQTSWQLGGSVGVAGSGAMVDGCLLVPGYVDRRSYRTGRLLARLGEYAPAMDEAGDWLAPLPRDQLVQQVGLDGQARSAAWLGGVEHASQLQVFGDLLVLIDGRRIVAYRLADVTRALRPIPPARRPR